MRHPRKDIPSFWRDRDARMAFLHLGENPFPPTESVQAAIADAARNANRYPDTNALRLREALAEYIGHGATPANLIVGNGSDDLIDLAVLALTQPGDTVATFEPSFFVYRFCAERHGREIARIPRDARFHLPDSEALAVAHLGAAPALTFIANPNNPTGTLASRDELLRVVDAMPGMALVDECYYEFSGVSVAELALERKNLVVLRSLSKSFGLSGLRLGYAVAHPETVERMERFAMTFPVNALAQAAGIAALRDLEAHRARIQELIERRESLSERLLALGLEVPPSATNFILAIWPRSTEEPPAQALVREGILVSDQTEALGLGRPALRIAVGSQEENERVAELLKRLLG